MPLTPLSSGPTDNTINSTEFGSGKLTSAEFRETHSNSEYIHRTNREPDKTPDLLGRLTNEAVAFKVAQEVRQAYKAGLGSTNKLYLSELASPERKKIAQTKSSNNKNVSHIHKNQLNYIRTLNFQAFKLSKVVTDSSPLKVDAGNCGELANAAAKLTIAYGGYAERWTFPNDDHGFTIVGQPPENTTILFKNWKDCWVVDPWANIVCKAPEYVSTLKSKMTQWAIKGKVIVSRFGSDGSIAWESPLHPKWIKAIESGEKAQLVAPSPDNQNPWAFFSASLGDDQRFPP